MASGLTTELLTAYGVLIAFFVLITTFPLSKPLNKFLLYQLRKSYSLLYHLQELYKFLKLCFYNDIFGGGKLVYFCKIPFFYYYILVCNVKYFRYCVKYQLINLTCIFEKQKKTWKITIDLY